MHRPAGEAGCVGPRLEVAQVARVGELRLFWRAAFNEPARAAEGRRVVWDEFTGAIAGDQLAGVGGFVFVVTHDVQKAPLTDTRNQWAVTNGNGWRKPSSSKSPARGTHAGDRPKQDGQDRLRGTLPNVDVEAVPFRLTCHDAPQNRVTADRAV